jgi:hypothetical protein
MQLFSNSIFKEIFVWIFSFIFGLSILYPVFYQIEYRFFIFHFVLIVLFIQFFRWTIFFEDVILFKNSWVKFFSIITLLIFAFVSIVKIQDIILLFENQDLVDIAINHKAISNKMTLPEIYHLYQYLSKIWVAFGYTTAALSVILAIRILAGYIGFSFQKTSKYLSSVSNEK